MCQNDGSWYKGGWVHLQNFLVKFNLLDYWSWNGTYKTGTLGGAKLYVGTYENVDGARGATECAALYLDEFTLSNPNIMAALAPCLRGHDRDGNLIKPKIRAVSTPNMQSLWQLMIVEHDKYGIRLLRTKLSEVPDKFVSKEQKELMAASRFDEKLRRQEIEGEVILGEDATSIITLKDFPLEAPYFSDDRVYAGLDLAHTGQRDGHVFAAIKGNKLLALHEFGMAKPIEVCEWIRKFHKENPIFSMDIDLAWSEAVYETMQYEINCRQVSFAEKAPDEESQRQYANIRAYGYFKLAKMHRNGLCVDMSSPWIDEGLVAEYKREIVNTHFIVDRMGRLLIEPKDDIRIRLGRSPDPADAMMLAALERAEQEPVEINRLKKDTQRTRRYANFMG